MNQEPTKEQQREFWELCGLKRFASPDLSKIWHQWRYPDGEYHKKPPPIDLNNLFKYAVMPMPPVERYRLLQDWLNDMTNKGYPENPALALLWAIYKALGGKDEKD